MTEKSTFKKIAITIVFFWISVFVFIPNMIVLVTSFLERDEVRLIRDSLSLESYGRFLDPVFFKIFTDSFFYAFVTTVLCLLIAYPFAYLLSRTGPAARKVLLMLVIIPFWTSSLIRTYALIIILKANGLINTFLLFTGLIDRPLMLLYTNTAVFIGLVYTLMPFMILPIYASIEKLDKQLVEAAYDLGAGTVQVFARVIVPLTLPGIIAGCIIVFLPAMGLFYIPDLMGGAKTMLIGNFIKNQFLTARDWPFGSAASVILTLVMGVMLSIYFRSLRRFNMTLIK